MSDNRLQEIMTRAVVGRTERTLTWCHKLAASDMKQVLGVRVGRTNVSVKGEEGQPVAELMVDCDLWCADGKRTKVLRTRCRSVQEVPVKLRDNLIGEEGYAIELTGTPRSTGVRVDGDSIYVDFEATVQVEVIALARLCVKAYAPDFAADLTGEEASTYDASASPFGSH